MILVQNGTLFRDQITYDVTTRHKGEKDIICFLAIFASGTKIRTQTGKGLRSGVPFCLVKYENLPYL